MYVRIFTMPDSLVAYSSQCKALPKQVSAIIRQIERHLRCMEDLLNQDQGYLLDPLVQDTIKEFQLCANCWLPLVPSPNLQSGSSKQSVNNARPTAVRGSVFGND